MYYATALIMLLVLPLSHCLVERPMILMILSAFLALFGSMFYLLVIDFSKEWRVIAFMIFKEVVLMTGIEYCYIGFLQL